MKLLFASLVTVIGIVPTLARAEDAPAAKSEATSFTCTQGKMTRTVAVEYANPSAKAPCKVNYVKATGAEAKVIFSADKQVGFCEKKAADFVEKLKSSGWTCN